MQNFASVLQERRRETSNTSLNNVATVNNNREQTPNRPGFPMSCTDFVKKFGAPVAATVHNRLTGNNGQPLCGLRFGKTIVAGLEPEVFASKALMDTGFTHKDFIDALRGQKWLDTELNISCHEGSNEIFISPARSSVIDTPEMHALLATFSQSLAAEEEPLL